ncbi:hypothetical protein SKAU_G00098590 [Synaphobranchus kaupii]|uniref:Uncharacterized protein n=1 Tax=Synaphobranchus kaupii TaxID=118154 RepID=A0A9Q1FZ37_SYNKA|nr:hypothetical protein SKAU_G00098590 [Synaphobranchus kaupii]
METHHLLSRKRSPSQLFCGDLCTTEFIFHLFGTINALGPFASLQFANNSRKVYGCSERQGTEEQFPKFIQRAIVTPGLEVDHQLCQAEHSRCGDGWNSFTIQRWLGHGVLCQMKVHFGRIKSHLQAELFYFMTGQNLKGLLAHPPSLGSDLTDLKFLAFIFREQH